jgi:probable F420-dependent oxidoreductase
MDVGFALPVSGAWATPANQVHVARRAEALGYRSLWTFQRLLIPAEPEGVAASPAYRSVLDPVVSLAHVAAVTERVRLGVAVLNMPFFSPALLAKQLASLDVLCGGRLDAGLGLGWSPEEYAASGVPYERRGARGEEFLAVLRALWTQEVAEHHGEFYELPPVRSEPKPVQRPHPPILLGGTAEPALRRAGRLADGWISSSRADMTNLHTSIAVIAEAARQAGRDPATLRYVARVPVHPGPAASGPSHTGPGHRSAFGAGHPDRRPLTGSFEQIKADLGELAAQGLTELFVDLNWNPQVGSPDADPAAALALAEATLEALAPA